MKNNTDHFLSLMWFHGCKDYLDFKNMRPSPQRPLWLTSKFRQAQDYSGRQQLVRAVTLNPNAKIFNFYTDCMQLKGQTYFF